MADNETLPAALNRSQFERGLAGACETMLDDGVVQGGIGEAIRNAGINWSTLPRPIRWIYMSLGRQGTTQRGYYREDVIESDKLRWTVRITSEVK